MESVDLARLTSRRHQVDSQNELSTDSATLLGAARKIYFRELLIESNLLLRLVPRPLTTAMIANEMPAAINPYSMAVAPLWSRQNLKTKLFIISCPQLSLGTGGLHGTFRLLDLFLKIYVRINMGQQIFQRFF